jgi:hypothetical protein
MVSCEQGYSYSYNLFNNTDTIISVYLKTRFKDSSFTILPKETKEIFTTFHGFEGFGGPFYSAVKNDLNNLLVKRGIKFSSKNYRETNLWKFEKKNDFKAVYKAVVTNAEF